MKSRSAKSFLIFGLITILLGGMQTAHSANSVEQTQRYIVTFSNDVDSDKESNELKKIGINVEKTFKNALKGVVGQFTATQIANLQKNPKFLYAELDGPVYTTSYSAVPVQDGPTPAPVGSWGIDRINQRSLPLDKMYSYQYDGQGVTAYVIDTGINAAHSEFTGKLLPGNDQIADGQGTNDCNGHGTHVAGTIGGTRYGVARAVKLVPVRVLNCAGSGTLTGVIAGIDWVIEKHGPNIPAVANLSLGSSLSASVNTAVSNLVADGVVVAVAAGNSNANACNYSPASTPTAITVGATDSSDIRAYYSNFGTCLDIFAPGSAIASSWIGSDIATNSISGTSMASPHVAGAAALLLEQYPLYSAQQIRDLMLSMSSAGKVLSPGTGSSNALLTTLTADYVSGTRAVQIITFNQPAAMAVGTANQTLIASSTSSMLVTFTTNNPAICTIVSGNFLRAVSSGSCVVTANQLGYLTYEPAAPVNRTVAISAPVPPAAPFVSTSTPSSGTGRVSINLKGVNAPGAAPIQSYTIYLYKSTTGVTTSPFVSAGTYRLTTTSLNATTTITGLTSGSYYAVMATANSSSGSSSLSTLSNWSRVR